MPYMNGSQSKNCTAFLIDKIKTHSKIILLFYKTLLLDQFTGGYLQNGPDCLEKRYRSQEEGF